MKDGCILKLTIIKTGHHATQYKKVIDTLLILWVDKNFRYINGVFCRWADLLEAMFLLPYPDPTQRSITYGIEIKLSIQLEYQTQVLANVRPLSCWNRSHTFFYAGLQK